MFDPFSIFKGGPVNAESMLFIEEQERNNSNIDLTKMEHMWNAHIKYHPEADINQIAKFCGYKYTELTKAEREWWRQRLVSGARK